MFIPPAVIGFKPLHSGAFLLTTSVVSTIVYIVFVSNPFIAGHSFLLVFTSLQILKGGKCFKPLHSGAFLLTLRACYSKLNYMMFQTPS